jgi:hypothetical protein
MTLYSDKTSPWCYSSGRTCACVAFSAHIVNQRKVSCRKSCRKYYHHHPRTSVKVSPDIPIDLWMGFLLTVNVWMAFRLSSEVVSVHVHSDLVWADPSHNLSQVIFVLVHYWCICSSKSIIASCIKDSTCW